MSGEARPISRLAAGAFGALVLATGGAFFAAQELKSTPPAVQEVTVYPFFSPNQDGRYDRGRASFILKRSDDVTATMVDRDGDRVRELVSERSLGARQRLRLAWDGRDDDGQVVPDGTYRVQLRLGRQGRTILLPRNMVKDTKPPPLKVLSIGPERRIGPEVLPRADGRPATVRFQAPGQRKSVVVLRTDVVPARSVYDAPIPLRDDQDTWTWDGTDKGRRVPAGTYVVVLRGRDQAGNVGSSVPEPIRLQYGERFAGKGGITVRYLTAQAPTEPVPAGSRMAVAVDSAGEPYDWQVRRVGQPAVRARGSGTKSRVVRFTAPEGRSGLYVFEVRTGSRRTAAPFVLQAGEPEDVLVIYPVTTWQGRNARDDDGDGRVDTLGAGMPVELRRPFTGDGIPPQVRRHEALLTAALDRQDRLYDATTDIALARADATPTTPQIAGHKAVIIAGDARWLDAGVARRLRAFVEAGGRVLTVGTGSLKRTVRVTPGVRAIDVTQPTRRDLFGFDVRPLVRAPTTLTNTVDDIDLFEGTAGTFGGFSAFEETAGLAGGGKLVAVAATEDGERDVLVAGRVGRGLVIRTGLPGFSGRLAADTELDSFLARAWAVLRQGG